MNIPSFVTVTAFSIGIIASVSVAQAFPTSGTLNNGVRADAGGAIIEKAQVVVGPAAVVRRPRVVVRRPAVVVRRPAIVRRPAVIVRP